MAKTIFTPNTSITSQYSSSSNLWTLVNNDFESIEAGYGFQVEIAQQATGYRSGASDKISELDSEFIKEVAPDYLPYLEEGCNVAILAESSSDSNRNVIIGYIQDELQDWQYFPYTYGSGSSIKYGLVAFGTANATQTQFYTPKVTDNSSATGNTDIKVAVLWDNE